MAFGTGADLRIVSRARLPNRFAEQGEIVAFRSDGDTAEHVALLIGAPDRRSRRWSGCTANA